MKSIDFPKLFIGSSTSVKEDKEATFQNLKLLLSTEKGEFKSDPFYGIRLKRYKYNQNNSILKSILIDEIFDQIRIFLPQIKVDKKDITIIKDENKRKARLSIRIKCLYLSDFTTNIYNLVLFEGEE